MRTPSTVAPAPDAPRAGRLYAVRYVDLRGQAVTRLFRFAPAAERFADRVFDRGGSPAVYVVDLPAWRPA